MVAGPGVTLKASSLTDLVADAGSWLRPQLGPSAGTPTCGLFVWLGLLHSMVAGFQEEQVEVVTPLMICVWKHVALFPP